VISNPLCYEIMTPESVGVPQIIVLGKHSGRHALALRYEDLAIRCSREVTKYERFTSARRPEKHIYDQDLIALLQVGSATTERIATEAVTVGAAGRSRLVFDWIEAPPP